MGNCASICDCINPRPAKDPTAIPNPFGKKDFPDCLGGKKDPRVCETRYYIHGPHPNGLKY